jgi:hypothetical protein
VVELVVVLVERRQRIDVVTLALRLQPCLARGVDRRLALGEHFRRQWDRPGERVVEHAERAQPVRHAAGRVGREGAVERRLVELPGERVVVRHREVELSLRGGVAFHLEVHFAELGRAAARVVGAGWQRCA